MQRIAILLFICATFINGGCAKAQEVECENFQPDVEHHWLTVPINYKKPEAGNLKVYFWIQRGSSTDLPPLLLLFGGPSGKSATIGAWPAVTQSYKGDVVGLMYRGEGCSEGLPPPGSGLEKFSHLRARVIVEDLELLRTTMYPSKKWRVFGQSRGSAIAHYYLEMYPESLESLTVHGMAMASLETMQNYSAQRAIFSARAAKGALVPASMETLERLGQWLNEGPKCYTLVGVEGSATPLNICGRDAIDALSFELTSTGNIFRLSSKVMSLNSGDLNLNFGIDPAKANKLLGDAIKFNNYILNFNYIVGTNGQDFGHPNGAILEQINSNPEVRSSPICEGRFVGHFLNPWYRNVFGKSATTSADPIDFEKVRKFMRDFESKSGKKFVMNVFFSRYDSIAGPEAFEEEQKELNDWANFQLLILSGHDGWTEGAVERSVLRP